MSAFYWAPAVPLKMSSIVAALYCLPDGRCVYRSMLGVDVWDETRDARQFPGGMPVVAHPPCGPWGRMRQFCKGGDGLRELALLAVKQVRDNGGVLEHPACSSLWPFAGLPKPGEFCDEWGGIQLRSVLSFTAAIFNRDFAGIYQNSDYQDWRRDVGPRSYVREFATLGEAVDFVNRGMEWARNQPPGYFSRKVLTVTQGALL